MAHRDRAPLASAATCLAAAVLAIHCACASALLVTYPGGASFTNADVPYGCAPYNVSSPLPFVLFTLVPGCVLPGDWKNTASLPPITDNMGAFQGGPRFVGYVNFQDAVQNAGCQNYADLVHNILPQLDAVGLAALVVSQPDTSSFLPGFRDFYGPDYTLYTSDAFAITVITPTDGDTLAAWFAQAALNKTNTTATLSSQPSEWEILAEAPGITAGQVIMSFISFSLALFVVSNQCLLIFKVGLWHYQLTLANRIQWCLLATFVIYGIYTLLGFELRTKSILGTPVFGTTRVFEYIGIFTGFTAFCLMLSGWARAITSLPGSRLRPYRWVFNSVLVIIGLLLMISLTLVIVSEFQNNANSPLAKAQGILFGIVGAIVLVLAVSMFSIGLHMIRLLLFDNTVFFKMSPQRKTLLTKVTVLMAVSSVSLVGLCLESLVSIMYRVPSLNIVLCSIEFVFIYSICVTILITLRYDAFGTSDRHSSSGNGVGPHHSGFNNSSSMVVSTSTTAAVLKSDDPDEIMLAKMVQHATSQPSSPQLTSDGSFDVLVPRKASSAMEDVDATIIALTAPSSPKLGPQSPIEHPPDHICAEDRDDQHHDAQSTTSV